MKQYINHAALMIDNHKLGCWGKQQLMTELYNIRKRQNSKTAINMAKTC